MAKLKIKEGDVFIIPLGNNEVGFGQILKFPHSKDSFIMCVFDYKIPTTTNYALDVICNSPIILLGYSLDAKLYHKDWEICGNYINNISKVELPYYRLGSPPDDIYITDFKGKILKNIDTETFNKLRYESLISPIRYENALKAYYGLTEWRDEDYNKILYSETIKSVAIAKNIL